MVLTMIYEGLLIRDDKGELQPHLAESWRTVSPTLYEFKIRRVVTFHNDREMDASDVKYSFERELEPKTGSPFRAIWAAIDKIEAPDKWTVRFHLKHPSAPFLNYLAGPTPIRSSRRRPSRRMATSGRVAAMPRVGSRLGLDQAEALRARGAAVLKTSGTPHTPPPAHVLEAASRAARESGTAHSLGLPELREAIAGKLRRENGVTVDPAGEVLVTSGAQQGLFLAMVAALEAGEEAGETGAVFTQSP
jgi:Bacterial extracellular solute-binding proteins, family 5 Middle/Aminotransferase class I and II